jgi:hypothetical protein
MRSNCVVYAISTWWKAWRAGEETYIVWRLKRRSRGFIHLLHGRMDPDSGQIAVTHFVPPEPSSKLFFTGDIVRGDDA